MKSHKDTQSTLTLLRLSRIAKLFSFLSYCLRMYIYIYLSLGTVLFENVYVDEASLRKTKGRVERKIISLLKMERKNAWRTIVASPESLSLGRGREKTEIRFWLRLGLTAGRFSQDQCAVSILRKPSAVRHRDGNKYNQRTKRADNILDVATRWPSKEEFFPIGMFFPQDCPQDRSIY